MQTLADRIKAEISGVQDGDLFDIAKVIAEEAVSRMKPHFYDAEVVAKANICDAFPSDMEIGLAIVKDLNEFIQP